MNKLQEKLEFLLDKYSVEAKAKLVDENIVLINGKEIPLLSHRGERRFTELKNLVQGGTLVGISVMRTARIVGKGTCLNSVLYRELDLCQWILNDRIEHIMTIKNDNVLNAIAKTEKGIVCTIEISATLADGTKPVDKHEITSQRGVACDKVVDTQIMQNSIYVYGEENKEYTDVDFELFGLEIEEIAIVRQAFEIAKCGCYDELISADAELKMLLEMSDISAKCGERVVR